jgi:hypothetical protein
MKTVRLGVDKVPSGERQHLDSSGVGVVRASLARVLSGFGAVAYVVAFLSGYISFITGRAIRRISGDKRRLPGRWPIAPIAVAAVVALLGLYLLNRGIVSLQNPSPVPATLAQIVANDVPGGQEWVTVSGVLESGSIDASYKNAPTDRVYVIDEGSGTAGLMVRSAQPLGQPGTRVTVTGDLAGATLQDQVVSNRNTLEPWFRQAAGTFPSVHVINSVYMDANVSPGSSEQVPLALLIFLASALLVVGAVVGYVVFIPSGSQTDPGSPYPVEDAPVSVSGLTVGDEGRVVWLRKNLGTIEVPDHDDNWTEAGPIVIDCQWMDAVEFYSGDVEQVELGTMLPMRGPSPAIRVRFGRSRLIIGFDDTATRDRWLRVLPTLGVHLPEYGGPS